MSHTCSQYKNDASFAEPRGRVANIPDSHSGGPGFKTRRPVILTEGFRGFTQFLHENAGIDIKIRPRPLPSISFLIHRSLITLSFDTIESYLQRSVLK
jgi:hypothetical protein